MVNVVIKGSEREKFIDCRNCESRLSYMPSDVENECIEITEEEKELSKNRGRDKIIKRYIVCPECGNKVYLNK